MGFLERSEIWFMFHIIENEWMLTCKFDGKLFQNNVFSHQIRLTESHRYPRTIVIQRRIQRIHSILSAKTVCLLFSISVYFLFGYLELISSATTRVSIPLIACTLLRLPLWGNIAQCCRPQLNHNTQLEQMKSNKQGLLMVFESF